MQLVQSHIREAQICCQEPQTDPEVSQLNVTQIKKWQEMTLNNLLYSNGPRKNKKT